MKLSKLTNHLDFELSEGEDAIVEKLYESYTHNTIEDFVYLNRHYLDKVSPERIGQFLSLIGEANKFRLQTLHEAFIRQSQIENDILI